MRAGMVREPYPPAENADAFLVSCVRHQRAACAQKAKADVVVAVAGVVVVAVRRTAIRRVVTPVAAAYHAVRACYGHVPMIQTTETPENGQEKKAIAVENAKASYIALKFLRNVFRPNGATHTSPGCNPGDGNPSIFAL